MLGNVTGIVDSMFAADNVRSRQNTANTNTKNSCSDYLDYALLNSRSGSLLGTGIDSGYSYMNGLSGSIWQTFALKALIDGMQKSSNSAAEGSTTAVSENRAASGLAEKKPDWAKIRVVQYYKAPTVQQNLGNQGILI